MMKKLATGLAAVAATSALALALPTAASASTTDDYSDSWGPVYSQHYQAKAAGWIGVEWDDDQESNTVTVKGKLWNLDHHGKCAYVKFQASDFDDDWSTVYHKTYCGSGYKRIYFPTDDASSIRVKVCQIGYHSSYPKNCGDWEYLYTNESE